MVDLSATHDECFCLPMICRDFKGFPNGMRDDATGTQVKGVAGENDIDPVGKGFADAFKGLPSHDHMVRGGRFPEILKVRREVPGDLPFDTYSRMLVHGHDS